RGIECRVERLRRREARFTDGYKLLPELGCRCHCGRVVIGEREAFCAHVGDVTPWKTMDERNRGDAGALFAFPHRLDKAFHRLARRVESADGAAIEHGLRRPPILSRAALQKVN